MSKKETELYIKKELPRGLVVSSFIAIVFVLALIPFIAWLLEYKDTISAPLTMMTQTTPVDVYAKTPGDLIFSVKDGETVSKGQTLAYIQNTADIDHVDSLKQQLQQKYKSSLDFAKSICSFGDLSVGEIKPYLTQVNKVVEDYQAFKRADRTASLVASNQQQINLYENRKTLLHKKGGVIAANQQSENQSIERQKKLLENEVIAPVDFEDADRKKYVHQIATLDNQTSINDLDILMEQLRNENIKIEKIFKEKKLLQTNSIKEALQLLTEAINQWELKYLIKANIDGICLFKGYLDNYKFVAINEKIFSLIPQNNDQYLALLKLPLDGAGKIRKKQEVYVKLNNYPFMEYGVLKGNIHSISPLPFDQHYNVQVEFPNGFTSTYDSTFAITAKMQGIGEVVIHRKSLWKRIGEQVKSLQLNR